jgi:hypothetical protein
MHALEAEAVREVLRAPQLEPLPWVPEAAVAPSLMAWQGRPLLVLDLGTCLLGKPCLAGGEARFLVWTQAQHAGVLVVENVGPLIRLSPTAVTRHWAPSLSGLPPPWNALRGLLHGLGAVGSASTGAHAQPIAVFDVVALWQLCCERLRSAAREAQR